MIKRDNISLRYEYKYSISPFDYRLLKTKLNKVMKVDPNSNDDGSYFIRSLYFDDIRNSALTQKLSGVHDRKKYRIRLYNHNANVIKLEKKIKINNMIGKEIAFINKKEVEKILTGDVSFLAESNDRLLRCFYLEYKRNLLRPDVIVDYYREAFVSPLGNVRITFDLNLHTANNSVDLFNNDIFKMQISDLPIILEVKFDNYLPKVLKELLTSTISNVSISKYVNCKRYTKKNSWEDQ